MPVRGMLIWMFGALTIGGCATTYQQHGLTGGYSERKINDSAYVVSFNGNGHATKDRVWYFWIYRCAELTSKQGYSLFSLRQNQPAARAPRESDFVPAVYNANEPGQLMKVKGGSAPRYIYIPGSSVTTWNSSATVLMYHEPLPQEMLWAFNAQTVLDQLKPYVSSNGSAPAPSRGDLLKHALTAHDRVAIGDHIEVGTTGAFTAADAPPGMRPRSASSIQSGMDLSRLLMFHAAYREYSLRAMDALGGRVVLAFVISPNGAVKDARVVSTTFTNKGFAELILEIVRRINFGPLDVGETRVSEFPISFSPQ